MCSTSRPLNFFLYYSIALVGGVQILKLFVVQVGHPLAASSPQRLVLEHAHLGFRLELLRTLYFSVMLQMRIIE